jgi:hypothetical protein
MLNEHKKFWNNDMRHMFWLMKKLIALFLKGDIDGSTEAWYFVKTHWNYKSNRIR